MQKILEKMFYGDICPNERIRLLSTEYEVARNAAILAHAAFEDKLTGELKKELNEVFSKDSEGSGVVPPLTDDNAADGQMGSAVTMVSGWMQY